MQRKIIEVREDSEIYLAIQLIRKTMTEDNQTIHEVIAEWDEDLLIKNTVAVMDLAFYSEFNVSKYKKKEVGKLQDLADMYEDLKSLVKYALEHGLDMIQEKSKVMSYQEFAKKDRARLKVLEKARAIVGE